MSKKPRAKEPLLVDTERYYCVRCGSSLTKATGGRKCNKCR